MALDSWLTRVKSAIRSTMNNTSSHQDPTISKRSSVGILAFEIAGLMSKLVHLWRSLSDAQIHRLRHDTIALEGVRKIVSDDDAFLLGIACAEFTETLRLVADSVSILNKRCVDQELRQFGQRFQNFADSGEDPNRWAMSWKEMDAKSKKMDKYIAATAALYKEMDELSEAEHGLKKLLHSHQLSLRAGKSITTVADVQQKIFWQRQELKYLRQTSLWGCSFDSAVSLLARSCFTIFARIKHVFGIGCTTVNNVEMIGPPLPRSLSVSAVVYPSETPPQQQSFASGPIAVTLNIKKQQQHCGLFDLASSILVPPETTLGAAALAMHYANVIAVIEKMIRTPRAVGPDARDDLYAMLPASVRGFLRSRLRGVGWGAARDAGLAAEWRAALGRIVEWLGPLAHNTIRWQGERSFERRSAAAPKANVLLLQTLYFANREKVEAAIAELLVGLNYVWRFEMELCLDQF